MSALEVFQATLAFSILVAILARGLYLPLVERRRLTQVSRAFGVAVELRSPLHRGLSQEVERLVNDLAKALQLNGKAKSELIVAIHLRDIGLCAVPHDILNDDVPWTEARASTYDRHPEIGAAMLEMMPSLSAFAEIVRQHHRSHESAPDAPVGSRIINVLADYVWLRRYRDSGHALDRLRKGAGTRYDPQIVDALQLAVGGRA